MRGSNIGKNGAPFRRLSPFEAFCGMFWGDIDQAPKAKGGVLGTNRPAPFAFWFIAIAVVAILGIIFADGWMKVHSGVPYDDHGSRANGTYSTGGN